MVTAFRYSLALPHYNLTKAQAVEIERIIDDVLSKEPRAPHPARSLVGSDGRQGPHLAPDVKLFRAPKPRVQSYCDQRPVCRVECVTEASLLVLRDGAAFTGWEHVDFANGVLTVPRFETRRRQTCPHERHGAQNPSLAAESPEGRVRVPEHQG